MCVFILHFWFEYFPAEAGQTETFDGLFLTVKMLFEIHETQVVHSLDNSLAYV